NTSPISFQRPLHHRDPHSFPTRRSSDLDSVRAWGDGSERNAYFRYINRNKKGITLDYKQPEGRALFLKLVESVDVLVELQKQRRSEEHTSELQSQSNLVCRLLLEKKKQK